MKFAFPIYFLLSFFTYAIGYEYDYIVVSFQWEPATCREPFTQCRQNPREDFSIHGVWPTKYQGPLWIPAPTYCAGGKSFDRSVCDLRYGDLRNAWPNMLGENFRFWKA
ncbi:putative ribonuclease T(2) [Medicago truncatula]|uniref:Putative ribonuclease T(2) n=1 Tax=Medicago truncatula TaxID=3880 RepID=A0A396HFK1_MEDTR|nr:putative ribonuclease T(2) [Medicago truncatula]